MSNALAIAGVTATLEYCLNLVYSSAALGGVSVSALAPDIVQTNVVSGSSSQLHVNLFLHQVAHNAAWRNVGLPSLAADGSTRLKNPPLALDLHYLLTAYASEDTQAEALLGFAILMLHENPVLPRSQINSALTNLPSTNPLAGVLSSSGLAEQIEMIKITPATLGREELAWLWTALKADYRPTYCFQVSVVLIESQLASSPGLPVLSRTVSAQAMPSAQFGSGFAQLSAIQLPMGQSAPIQGDTVILSGTGLGTVTGVALSNQRLGILYSAPLLTPATDSSISFTVPTDADKLPAGAYSVAVTFTDTSGALQTSNSLPMGIAPAILTTPAPVATTNSLGSLVTLTCNPKVQTTQSVSLALGSSAVPAQALTAATDTLSFQFPTLAAGPYLARLQVDGAESPVAVNWPATPPVFTGPFVTI
jgi:hypothetical protein